MALNFVTWPRPTPRLRLTLPPRLTLLHPQLLSCVFVEQMQSSFCWVIQLFSLVCTVKGYYDREWAKQAAGAPGVLRDSRRTGP